MQSLSQSKCIFSTPKTPQIWHSLFKKMDNARKNSNEEPDEILAKYWNERERNERDRELFHIDVDNVGYLHSISGQIIQLQHDMTDLLMYEKDISELIKWNKMHKPLGMLYL